MSYDILIQTLANGEVTTNTAPDGTVYQETRPPTRVALQAARALQNLHQQCAINQQLIQQLQQQNQELHNEIKSLRLPETSGGTQ